MTCWGLFPISLMLSVSSLLLQCIVLDRSGQGDNLHVKPYLITNTLLKHDLLLATTFLVGTLKFS